VTEINYHTTYGNLDAVYVHTLEAITWCNERGARLLGYDEPAQLIGKSPFEFATDEHYFARATLWTSIPSMKSGTPSLM
jgi:PAS domain-containing protein